MATLNEHTSVPAVILSDISDHSDTNFIYILPENKILAANKKEWQTDKRKHEMKSQFVYLQTHESRD